jgi:hypothetical protein
LRSRTFSARSRSHAGLRCRDLRSSSGTRSSGVSDITEHPIRKGNLVRSISRWVCSAAHPTHDGRRARRGRGVHAASLPRQSRIAAAARSSEAGSAWLATGAQTRPPGVELRGAARLTGPESSGAYGRNRYTWKPSAAIDNLGGCCAAGGVHRRWCTLSTASWSSWNPSSGLTCSPRA